MISKHLPILFLVLGGLMLASTSLSVSNLTDATGIGNRTAMANHRDSKTDNFDPPENADPFAKVALSARAAIVLDIKSGEIIYAKNIHEKLPLASITKVMTVLVAENLIPLPQNTLITITPEDLRAEGDSGLDAGQIWRLKDLINLSLMISSNDGARAIAGVAGAISQKNFVLSMNDQARTLGLNQMIFRNETGLDLPDNGGSGAQGSAENVARLFAYIYKNKPGLLETTRQKTASIRPINDDPHFLTNTNEAVDQITGLIASKTGYTDLSGGNLAVIFDRGLNQPAVAVALGGTQEGRFADIVALTRASIENLQIILNANPRL